MKYSILYRATAIVPFALLPTVGLFAGACRLDDAPGEPVDLSEDQGALETAHVAAATSNADWMGQIIHSRTYLSEITIPGTHDSAATSEPDALPGTTKAQSASITAQLNDGVRFLDLRLREDPNGINFDDPLVPAHGPFQQPGSVGQIFTDISSFLAAHPHEMILISVKHEENPLASGISADQFQTLIDGFLAKPNIAPLFNRSESIPQYMYDTGGTKGRLVLIRRYGRPLGNINTAAPPGIDATTWTNNASDNVGSQLFVEDHYQFACFTTSCIDSSAQSKFQDVSDAFFLGLAKEGGTWNGVTWNHNRLRLVFASATTSVAAVTQVPQLGSIPGFANYVNPRLRDLALRHRGQAGVVIVDRETPDLIDALVGMNRFRPFEYDGRINQANGGSVLFRMPNGQDIDIGGGAMGSPAVSGGADPNQMSVFVIGRDRNLYTSWQTKAGSSTFSSWVNLGGGPLASNPTVVRLCSGIMQAFARGDDHAIWTTWQPSPGSTWSSWVSLQGIINSRPWASMSGCDATVSGIGDDGNVWSITRSSATNSWGSWHRA